MEIHFQAIILLFCNLALCLCGERKKKLSSDLIICLLISNPIYHIIEYQCFENWIGDSTGKEQNYCISIFLHTMVQVVVNLVVQ